VTFFSGRRPARARRSWCFVLLALTWTGGSSAIRGEAVEDPKPSASESPLHPDRWTYVGPEARGRYFDAVDRTAPPRDPSVRPAQAAPGSEPAWVEESPPALDRGDFSFVEDPPLEYDGPPPSQVEDIEARDGPRIPEPMVFDLVRGLGARRGELEVNVLALSPFRRGSHFEWAPEVEYAIADGFAVEFELPIFGTHVEATKAAAQYTFGTAFDDAFIHGAQGILYYDLTTGRWSPTALYVAGLRLNRTWSLLGMVGGTVGPQIFPFSEEPAQTGSEIITNLSLFADLTDDLVAGVETNLSRQLRGPAELLVMPQVHWTITKHFRVQFGMGMRDDVEGRNAELGFRVIWER